jgi:hypothetical protein
MPILRIAGKGRLILLTILPVLLLSIMPYIFHDSIVICYYSTKYRIEMIDSRIGYTIPPMVSGMLKHARDKRRIVMWLLSHEDGSFVSEGMFALVDYNYPDTLEILRRYYDDDRWNYSLMLNNEFAINCSIAYKINNGQSLSKEEEKQYEISKRWIQDNFNINK